MVTYHCHYRDDDDHHHLHPSPPPLHHLIHLYHHHDDDDNEDYESEQDEGYHDHAVTLLLVAWGQFIDHDITRAAETKDAM